MTGSAQEPSIDTVLKNAAAYLAAFQKQLSGIVAEETYEQIVKNQQRAFGNSGVLPRRKLKSDLLLVRPAGGDRYVELRDVFEVDGQPVRDRQDRLIRLFQDPSAAATDQIGAIIKESARYNIGNIVRTVNTPLMPMLFLDPAFQPRFKFKRSSKTAPTLGRAPREAAADSPVFRVSTEMWTIEFEEKRKGTVIKTPDGQDLPARGRFWINPESGAVLMSELIIQGGDLTATLTVSYQSEPLMGFLVPVEMRESYVAMRERIDGSAVYGRFRPIR